ncbi:sorbin [Echinococcus multilocularis]|uniref:Sorbin n=1 Tax=Echinococcus multilocularis TaxID=6211 RepID=A0A068Y1M0_ECHMU|nr:sorbin [Echinococcus multilocularis]
MKHAYSTFNISTSSADGQHLAREVLNNPYSTPPAEAMGLTGDQRFPAHEKPGKGSETNDNPGDDNAYRNEDPALGPQRKTWKPRPQSGIPPPLRPRSPSKDERQDKKTQKDSSTPASAPKINNETSGSQSKLSSHTSSRPPLICSSETNESDSDGASVKSMPPKDKDPAFTNPGALLARLFAELHQRLERPASPSDKRQNLGSVPSKAATTESSTKEDSGAEAPARRVLWLMIENIPETQQPLALEFKNNDIVRWLDYDPNYPESNPASLPAGRYLECETWSGKPVVVPSEYARLISSTLEQAQVLQHRPRAQVIKDFVGTTDGDLSVAVGEVIYLLFERDVSYFMAMNTSFKRGRVPKTALNVLVAP